MCVKKKTSGLKLKKISLTAQRCSAKVIFMIILLIELWPGHATGPIVKAVDIHILALVGLNQVALEVFISSMASA